MSMERTSKGFMAIGDQDLAQQFAPIQAEFARRHPEMGDIPLTGRLPGEKGLHPLLEGKVIEETLTIGGITGPQFLEEFGKKGGVGSYARSIFPNLDLPTLPTKTRQIQVARVKVLDLGILKEYPATADILGTQNDLDEKGNPAPFTKGKATELGLELSAEAALHYFLQNGGNLKPGELLFAGMKPTSASDGNPSVLYLGRDDGGLWLRGGWAFPSREWRPGNQLVFALGK